MTETNYRLSLYLAVSLIFHVAILSKVDFSKSNPVFNLPNLVNQPEVIAVSLIKEVEPPKLTKKAVSKPKKIIPKKIVKRSKRQVRTLPVKKVSTQKLKEYTLELRSFVEKNKVYPRLAARLRQSGKVEVKLKVGADGQFGQIEVISPAAFDTLNQGTVKFIKKLGKFKPLPEEFLPSAEFVIPIVYTMASKY